MVRDPKIRRPFVVWSDGSSGSVARGMTVYTQFSTEKRALAKARALLALPFARNMITCTAVTNDGTGATLGRFVRKGHEPPLGWVQFEEVATPLAAIRGKRIVWRDVVSVTQSPTNARRWLLGLSCGHEEWATAARRPCASQRACGVCEVTVQ